MGRLKNELKRSCGTAAS